MTGHDARFAAGALTGLNASLVPSLYGSGTSGGMRSAGGTTIDSRRRGQHPLPSVRLIALDEPVVTVRAEQPHQSAPVPRIGVLLRGVVVDERDGIRQPVTRLPLSPVNDLDDVGSRDVVVSVQPAVDDAPLRADTP
jgi:hypothetical protein